MTWRGGETVLARYVRREKVYFGGPSIVIEDSAQRTVLYTPMGTPVVRSPIDYDAGTLGEPRLESWHTTHNLRFLEPGAGYCISAMYAGNDHQFLCWYIDMIEPIRRTPDGFVLWDLALDIVVAPDLSWQMKDEDHFALMPAHGWITPEHAAQVRATCSTPSRGSRRGSRPSKRIGRTGAPTRHGPSRPCPTIGRRCRAKARAAPRSSPA